MTWWPFGEQARIGAYLLVEPLGQGGSGQVFRAWRDNATDGKLPCVLKFPLPKYLTDKQAIALYLKEGRIGMSLGNHTNIVKIIDVGLHKGMPFLAMEYVDGTNLHAILQAARARHRRVSLEASYHILASIASALHHAHHAATVAGKRLNVVHRDVKPGNVLVNRDGHVKVSDFGIAVLGEEGTTGGHIRGTHRYMSPEHVRSEVRPEMDVYALGVIAWELVENRVYRAECRGEEHYRRIIDGDIPPMHAADTPEQLASLILDCLHINPVQRPRASEFLMRLKRCPGFSRDPDNLAFELDEILGEHRPSGGTQAELAATPELVATFSALHTKTSGQTVLVSVPEVDESAPTVVGLPAPLAASETDEPPSGDDSDVKPASRAPVSATAKLGPPPELRRQTVEVVPSDGPDESSVTSSDSLQRVPTKPAPRRGRVGGLVVGALTLGAVIVGASYFATSWLAQPEETAAEPESTQSTTHTLVEPAEVTPAAPTASEAASTDAADSRPTRPTPSPDEPVATDRPLESPSAPATEVETPPTEPAAEHVEPTDPPSTDPPAVDDAKPDAPKAPPPHRPKPTVQVHVALDFVSEVTLAIGSKRTTVHSSAELKVIPGNHRIRWRTGEEPWQSLGRHRFEDGGSYFIRIGPSSSRIVDLREGGH